LELHRSEERRKILERENEVLQLRLHSGDPSPCRASPLRMRSATLPNSPSGDEPMFFCPTGGNSAPSCPARSHSGSPARCHPGSPARCHPGSSGAASPKRVTYVQGVQRTPSTPPMIGATKLSTPSNPAAGTTDQRRRRPISSPSMSLKDLRTDVALSASQINGHAAHASSASVTGIEPMVAAELPVAMVVGTPSSACQANANQSGVVSSWGTSSSRAFPLSVSTSALGKFAPQSDSGSMQPRSDEFNTDEKLDERLVALPSIPSQHTQMSRVRSGTAAPAMPSMRPPMLHQIYSLPAHVKPRLQLQPQHGGSARSLHEHMSSSREVSQLPWAQVRHTAETDQSPFNSDSHPCSPSCMPSAGTMHHSRSGSPGAGRAVAGSSGKRYGGSFERAASRSLSPTPPMLPTQGTLQGARRGSDRRCPSPAGNSQHPAAKLSGTGSLPSSRPSSPARPPSTPGQPASLQTKQRRSLDPSRPADGSGAPGSRAATSRVQYLWR
jgi:hypothetical protein